MSLSARPEIARIHPYTPGKSQLPGANRVTKLSSNEGAFGPPPGVATALASLATQLHRYPDGTAAALRQAIADRFALHPDTIVCGAGSDDILFLLAHIYGGPLSSGAGGPLPTGEGATPSELVMTAHGFAIYEIAGTLAGCRIVKTPERNLTTDVDAILAAVTPATRIVAIANPNNPTGTFIPTAEVARLRHNLPPNVLLILDAAYAEYVDRPDYDPGAHLAATTDNTIMTRTFSKIFGLGGLRLGWATAHPDIIANINRVRSPFNVSLAAHDAGLAALAAPNWVEQSRAHNSAERARLTKTLHDAGIPVTPSEANFVLADFAAPARAQAADAHLRASGIIVRNVAGYGLPNHLRITVGLAAENDDLIAALTAFARTNPPT